MKRCFFVFFFLIVVFSVVMAEESSEKEVADNTEQPAEGDEEDGKTLQVYEYKPIRKGDKYIRGGVGLGIPLFNTSRQKFAINTKMYPGAKLMLGIHFYLTNSFSLGADMSFEFYPTIAKNLYFALPISLTMAYTPTYKKWRFPMGCGVGFAFQSYNTLKYYGMYLKPFFSFFYQYSPEWSFGGEFNWAITPEWRKNTEYNRIHNNFGIAFAVRYHF
ncbi:MAG: hypothetical protein CR988_08100 [Treponema sp.]|nr:MAG: hypothetical protein CR988_08100 [Treponema sp.]